MQVLVNDRLVKRQAKIGAIALVVTFGLLLLGMLLSWQVEGWARNMEAEGRTWVPIAVTYGIVIVAMALYYYGNTRLRRYGPQHRHDARLTQILKGLDNRYALFAFLGRGLPDYILLGPSGVHVIIARSQKGEITCRDNRWTIKSGPGRRLFTALYGNPIGNPGWDASQNVKKVQAFLDQRLPADVERPQVQGVIVFTSENVRLRSERCSFTATTARGLRKMVQGLKGRLNPADLAQVRAAFDGELGR